MSAAMSFEMTHVLKVSLL